MRVKINSLLSLELIQSQFGLWQVWQVNHRDISNNASSWGSMVISESIDRDKAITSLNYWIKRYGA